MDIIELGAVGELVGGFAVIGSLIYLGFQVRQSAVAARSAVHQAAAANSTALLVRGADRANYAVHRLGNDDYEALSDEDRNAFDNNYMVLFNYWEALYYDQLHGVVHEEVWQSRVRRMRFVFARYPASRTVWSQFRPLFGESFDRFVDNQARAGAEG